MALVVVVAGTAFAGCSRDGNELADPGPDTTSTTVSATATPALPGSNVTGDEPASTMLPSTTASAVSAVVPTFTVVEVPEEGVPGLDSLDQFCSSWSRFGGSFQVISVASAFLAAEPDAAFGVEVAAAPVVTTSFERLLVAWPAELESEYDTIATTVFGPFAARADDGMAALVAAGATEADITALGAAWISALGQRDPTTPEIALDLPSNLQALVDAAASDFADSHPAVFSDPALVNEVATPLTDQYLAVSCPDQGSLAGGEVGG